MSMIDAIPLLAGAGADGYQISRSVRLRSSASAYLSRTPASAGNRQKWTYSCWFKRGQLSTGQGLIAATAGTPISFGFGTGAGNNQFFITVSGVGIGTTTPVFRDPSSWYHVVIAFDTTQATSGNRVLIYVNGINYPLSNTLVAQNTNYEINNNSAQQIGTTSITGGTTYTDGYLTEINFIDGQALTPSSFGETNALTGVWQPKRYAGTYGTNGFYLNFSDNSNNTATTIGKDYSGNGNNWTPSAGISITAGATYDSMIDVPTPYADGGNGRGNYAVLNPLSTLFTVTAGNLDFTYTNSTSGVWYLKGTLAVSSDKYYWEVTPTNVGAGSNISIGIILSTNTQTNTTTINLVTDGYVYHCDGNKYSGAGGTTGVAYGATYTNNDVIGVALDLTAGTLVFYKNNVSQGTAFTGLTSSYMLLVCNHLGGTSRTVAGSVNAGQRPFTYTPPTGFVALNTQNLPAPTISNGATVMAATLYTGNDPSTQTITNTVNGVSFQPDLVWVKSRSNAYTHVLVDSVRGVSTALFSNLTNAEVTEATRYVYAFNSNGFSVKENISTGSVNATAGTYVGWQWNAGGSTVTNTSGSISSQVRANATAGFSVVTYTGAGGVSTIGHGLGVAPSFFVVKNRTQASDWECYFATLGNTTRIVLNSTAAQVTGVNGWNSTSPTSTVFTVNGGTAGNTAGNNHLAYCFAAVAGYSAFGKYTGNGSTDGPFVYLGFRPRWVMIKCYDVAGEHWIIYDTARNTYNVVTNELYANLSNAEGTYAPGLLDVTANGFKLRYASAPNASGRNYIYAAFAEVPFRYANAR